MRIKSERDFWSGLMFVVLGIAFAVGATSYGMGPECALQDACAASLRARLAQISASPGPGYFPLGLGILLAFFGAIALFKSLTFESEEGDPIGAFAWRPLLAIVAAIAGFGAMLQPFGLVLAVFVLVSLSSLASGDLRRFRWKGVAANAALLATLSPLVFVRGLHLAIPVWPWFIG